MPKVDITQIIKADDNWRNFFRDAPQQEYAMPQHSWPLVKVYLGHPDINFDLYSELPDDAYRRFMMLLGPHHATILRVYCIKRNIRWK